MEFRELILAQPAQIETITALTEELENAVKDCNILLGDAYDLYVEEIREEIKTLPRSFKTWSRLNRIL